MRVGVFHPGTQHSWQTALAFQETGMLSWYATSAFYDPCKWPYKLERYVPRNLSCKLNREFRRRYHPNLKSDKIRQFGFWEWAEVILRRIGSPYLSDYCNERGNREFCKQVVQLIEREPVEFVWGYNSSSLEVFQWAKKRGIRCILDQTVGHFAALNQIMQDEENRHPEFFVSSYRHLKQDIIDRQNAEMTEADVVVVGSEFCARTMIENGCQPNKIHIVSYGYDETAFPNTYKSNPFDNNRPIEFLFVGEVGPRKGIAYLLQAFQNIPANKAKLTLVGRLAIPTETFKKYADRVIHVPQVPRNEIVKYFTKADCFVFPSLFEGGGIVLYEACAAGLGVIQTDRCGDGVRSGRNGLILEEISVESLTNAINELIADPKRCERWREASWSIRESRTWANYRQNIVKLATSV